MQSLISTDCVPRTFFLKKTKNTVYSYCSTMYYVTIHYRSEFVAGYTLVSFLGGKIQFLECSFAKSNFKILTMCRAAAAAADVVVLIHFCIQSKIYITNRCGIGLFLA